MKLSFSKLSPKALTSFLCLGYILIMFCIYPFYMENGYAQISDAKYTFFLYSSLGAVLLLLFTGLVTFLKEIPKISRTDIFAFLFMVFSIISFFLSNYKYESFLGLEGWNMGLLTLLLVPFIYILISKLYEYESFVLYPILGASFVVFLLGILDRFSIYLLPLEVRNTAFLSTMGNINWFAGYYSVICPLGVGLLALELQKEIRAKGVLYLLFAFNLISFAFGFAQGAESVLLIWLALFLGLLFFAYVKMIRLSNVLFIIAFWASSALIIFLLRIVIPAGFNYGSGGVLDRMTQSPIMVIVLLGALAIRIIISSHDVDDKIIRTMFIFFVVSFFIWLGTAVVNTFIAESPFIDYDVFTLNEKFGSGRGYALKASFMVFREMSFKDWLFGIGPDSFARFAYNIPDISDYLRTVWPNDMLPNAHCEPITVLINGGFLGFISFYGILFSFIRRKFASIRKKFDGFEMCIVLSVTAYAVHNLISFTQVLNIPFLFILMGMSESVKNTEFFDKNLDKK